ncbi:MAG: cytochrome c oxidase subunit II [Longimicrobiales bacterium]|nr:cytochrome c oxidase subunit II [Longimicrobiales bacterium]
MEHLSWLLPESFSTFGQEIDRLYYVILWITGIVFVLTEGLLVLFLFRYRHREGGKAEHSHGNTTLEMLWTAGTAVLVLGLAVASTSVWHHVKRNVPEGALEVIVTAKQFEWTVTYPGADGLVGTDDDFNQRNTLNAPTARPILIHLRSEDVIHSFFIPEMRVKQDALPGRSIRVWFEATEPGEYVIGCAELCGLGHYRMQGRLTVHATDAYQDWLEGAMAEAAQ